MSCVLFSVIPLDGSSWTRTAHPRANSRGECREQARFHPIVKTPTAAFLCAHPLSCTQVATRTWPIMLQRHLELAVYDDDTDDMRYAYYQDAMDRHGATTR